MDLIDRQAVIDAIVNTLSEIGLHDNSEVARYGATFRQHEIIDIIECMPSVQSERKTGRWMSQKGGGYCCSECGRYALDEVDGNFIHVAFESNFCPYCGAKMERKTDG